MRTRVLIIIITIAISFLGYTQYVDAICMENQDWADAPCYGCIGCYPGLEQEKLDWVPYYDYKGSTWMESKKQQLETAIQNNALREWFEQDASGGHKNTHQYYFLQDEVPNIYGKNFDEALGFETAWNAVKDNSPDAPLLLWNYHDVILDGTLIVTDLAVTITGDHVPLYHIKVNKYFKGEKSSDMVTAVENPDDLGFDLLENGLFYLKKLENQNLYTVTIASVKTFGNCDARDLIEISPVLPNEKPARSDHILPEGFVDPCVPDYFDVDPDGMVLENVRVPEPEPEPEPDRPLGKNCGPRTIMEDGICVVGESQKTTTDSSGKWDSYRGTDPPLKQMQSGIKFHNVECKEGLQLIYKKTGDTSACVTLFTEIELVVRGWATDSRVMLGCIGDRIHTCYPDDPVQYRNDLYEYYFGDEKGLPPSDAFDFDSLYTKNACTDKPGVCYGKFENGTRVRIACDYPLHGCGVKSFGSYKINNDETTTIPWKKHITVSASNIDHSEIPESLSVYAIDDLSGQTMMETLLTGADGCKNKTEVCTISRGISIERMYPFGISVTGSDQYTATINQEQAEELMSQMQWTIKDELIYSVVSYNDKNYFLVISTFDKMRTPDAAMRLVNVSSDPVSLKKNSVLEYAIQIDTWATYGTDAEITLDSMNSARDSGINTWIEPDTMIVPERSNAISTLFIHATEDAQDGIYDIRVGGKANGENAGLHCGHTECPTVQIGDSDWSIRTFGSNTGMGIGSGDAPENTYLEIELNKEEFFDGETVEIRTYLVNNGTQAVVLNEPMNLLIKVIRADSKGYYSHFYGIDARNDSDNSITIEPNSKVVLVRPFYWDQMTFENLDEEHRVEEGSRKITATFVAREHTWKDNIGFEIK